MKMLKLMLGLVAVLLAGVTYAQSTLRFNIINNTEVVGNIRADQGYFTTSSKQKNGKPAISVVSSSDHAMILKAYPAFCGGEPCLGKANFQYVLAAGDCYFTINVVYNKDATYKSTSFNIGQYTSDYRCKGAAKYRASDGIVDIILTMSYSG